MTAPEDRVYCGDPWCDGDHVTPSDKCEVPIALDGGDPHDEPPC